jgi:hypothetical protein
VSGSREPLAGMGGRVVHVINAALRIREEIPVISAFASCCYWWPSLPHRSRLSGGCEVTSVIQAGKYDES